MTTYDPSALFGAGLIGILFFAVAYIALVALGVWLLYTVIWRAVRRGMREFHYPKQD